MKNKTLFLFGLIILFFVAPFIINFIVSTPSLVGFITVDKQDIWIGFYGSILGGILTLLGVAWTIKHSDSIREEDCRKHEEELKEEYEKRDLEIKRNLMAQYKPILNISFYSNFITEEPFGVSIYKDYYIQNYVNLSYDEIDSQSKRMVISLLVLNIGRGEARKVKIKSVVISADGEQWETLMREYNEIYIGNGININFYKVLNEKEWEQYKNQILKQPVLMRLQIDYEDLVGGQHSLESFVKICRFIQMKNEDGEFIPNVITLNPFDSFIQNETNSEKMCL